MSEEKPKPQTNYLNLPASAQSMPERASPSSANLLNETWKIAFRFGDETTSLAVGEPIMVGRATDEDDDIQLDLSPYGAYQGGVSRRHARIVLHEGGLYIEDIGSTNGTRINGFQLTPNRKYRLREGDEIEFARVRASIKFTR